MHLPLLLLAALAALAAEPLAPKPFTPVASVEGVSEYDLPNGLKLLLVPDDSVATVTVNLTVLVGSRHEGYGEKGMAHLLEHMLFKGSPKFKDPKKELSARGGRWNGTTREDRTNYFETFPASDANTEFAVRFEADRLVNAFVDKKDLDTEMTVVRNEFESSENNAARVLFSRVRGAALQWHNYGRAVIGTRADIERVPIENLKAFYKRYYQPDNAVLVIAGKYDAARVFSWVADSFGKLPRPARALGNTFTEEPVQDGERAVTVRRVGGTHLVAAAWRSPAVTDPDYPAMMVLQGVLGDVPQGRLHQLLVDGKKAASATTDIDQLREPGLFSAFVTFKPGDDVAGARDAMLTAMETPVALTAAEVARARDGWVSYFDQSLENSEGVGHWLSEWAAEGDWRMVYVQRDALKAVTVDDVQRVWAKYVKPQNRTLGEYVPTEKPDRAQVSLAPDVGPLVNGYKGGTGVAKGEVFDSSPANIEARTRRFALPGGLKVALLPKKTRAESVKLELQLRLGNAEALKGQRAVAELTALLMNRGTKKLGYKDFRSTLERLRAQLSVGGQGQGVSASLSVQRPQLAEALALLTDVLREPALDAKEFDALKNEYLAGLEQAKDEPQSLGSTELQRALSPASKDHPRYVPTFPERIADVKAVTLEQVRAFHARFYGASNGAVAVVGDFDAGEVEKALTQSFGAWAAKEPYALIADPALPQEARSIDIKTPDKANAWMGSGTTVKLNDASPDAPALRLGTFILGGGSSGRLFFSLREKKGLTYGAYARLDLPVETERAAFSTSIIYAPQNVEAVSAGLDAELTGWATIAPEQLERTRSEFLNQRAQSRANDDELASQLASQSRFGRTMAWEQAQDDAYRRLTPAQVSSVVKQYLDVSKLVRVRAGDFKTVAGPR
jgi:zinc protease